MHLPMMDYTIETVQRFVSYLYTGIYILLIIFCFVLFFFLTFFSKKNNHERKKENMLLLTNCTFLGRVEHPPSEEMVSFQNLMDSMGVPYKPGSEEGTENEGLFDVTVVVTTYIFHSDVIFLNWTSLSGY